MLPEAWLCSHLIRINQLVALK